jgi:hypothetical protein
MLAEEIKDSEEQAGSDLLSDCRLMLKFARTIPSEYISDFVKLDPILKQLKLSGASGLLKNLFATGHTGWPRESSCVIRQPRLRSICRSSRWLSAHAWTF